MNKAGLFIPNGMNERQLQEVRELARICNTMDGIELKLNQSMLKKRPDGIANDFLWYDQGKLVGFLALYHFVPKEAEVGGMIHPDYRRRGIFSALTEEAIRSARKQGVPALMFVCPNQSLSAQAFLKTKPTEYSYSEFGMKLAEQVSGANPSQILLEQGTASERALLIRLDSLGFESSEEDSIAIVDMILGNQHEDLPYIAYSLDHEPIGRINIHIRDGNAHIFGFSVLPENRRQGYGKSILMEAIQLAADKGLRSTTLEVSCENRKALELYHQCGFRETYVNDYYEWKL